MRFIVIFLILIAPLNIYAQSPCDIEGIVTDVSAGEFNTKAADGQNGLRPIQLTYTQISLRIIADSCKRKNNIAYIIRKYGLCDDVDIYKGNHLQATAKDWNYGGKCIADIKILKRNMKKVN